MLGIRLFFIRAQTARKKSTMGQGVFEAWR